MATFEGASTTSQASSVKVAYAQPGTLTGAVAVVRKIKAHLPADRKAQAWSDPPANGQGIPRLEVGNVLPEGAELHVVPRHESYRYAIVQGHRVIVDAASRQIVYIVR
ncbi:DUF1236 domain-containing protein [Microvirga sp. KLBC 81]|uniref:DUF1236 domain-containing protein n=1 Tax=Microvirga sp. KLBC 81 TaxID=1862707 RepID=UPI00352ED5BB